MRADVSKWQRSNVGRQPRGWGYWLFQVGGETFGYTGHYSEAKRAAFEFARTRGERVVEVLP
jgi:hypothetical protein